MKLSFRHVAYCTLLVAISGCSMMGGNLIEVTDEIKTNNTKAISHNIKHAATLRMGEYIDQRTVSNPRYLGKATSHVSGITGDNLILDRDVTEITTSAIKNRFDANGFLILEGEEGQNALFEVSGAIKSMELNVRNRDEINISIETFLKDASSGKIIWSGIVTEVNERFAGVSGNNKEDVAAYLKNGLRIVSNKTVEAITNSLMASRPELFTLTPGTKQISGVDVLVAPPASPQAIQTPSSNPALGLLSVNTSPARAKIYLDGVYFGLSPLHAELEPGVHDVVVKMNGYKKAAEKVSVRKGDNTKLEMVLER